MRILILGATSDIARALAARFAAAERADLYLAGRDMDALERMATDIAIRWGVAAEARPFDANDFASHEGFYRALDQKPDVVVVAFGYLGSQETAQEDAAELLRIIRTNYLGAVSILEVVAADFERRGSGAIIAIGSVAGERGRKSNYIYGSAKGGLAVYLQGLRHRLFRAHVAVMTVLPGYVRTKMTEHLDLPGFLTASPEEVAEDIYRAYKKGRYRIYSRKIWKWIMKVIRAIPESIFLRSGL